MPKRLLPWPAMLLAALVAVGLGAYFLDLFEWRDALEWTRGYAQYWWLPLALILIQVLMFMFALPGSTMLWIVAPLYAPGASTLILVAGGCAGSLAAFWFARRLSDASLARLRASHGYQVLERESDFLVLCALRLVPAFPHSVLNYGSGILRVPLGQFLVSAAIGFGVKAYLYSTVIYSALEAADPAELLRGEAVWPLIVLALALFAAQLLRRRWGRPPPD